MPKQQHDSFRCQSNNMRMKTLKQQQVDVDFEATIIQQHDNEDVEATQVVNFESTMIHQQNLNLNT
jgi:hypothetical protein